MIIRSISGNILYETETKSMKSALEECVDRGVLLNGANLRRFKLNGANLDGIRARGASFWGCDLEDVDFGMADLRGADMRSTNLRDSCFAQSDLSGADMRGAYFSRTIVEAARLDNIRVSCPSFWECHLRGAQSFDGAVYQHLGEREIPITDIPILVRGFERSLVFVGAGVFWGNTYYDGAGFSPVLEKSLYMLKAKIDQILKSRAMRDAKNPIPKIKEGWAQN